MVRRIVTAGMWMRARSPVLVATAVLVAMAGLAMPGLAGCASGHGARAAPVTGSVSGRLAIFGGPLDPKTGRMAADNTPGQNMTISVSGARGRVATTMTHTDGRYSLDLPAGRYTVTPACGAATAAVVAAGQETVLDLRCDVP